MSAFLARLAISVATVGLVVRAASAAGGAPFESTTDPAAEEGEGPVWDFSEPLWVFFAQERLLAPETPLGEAIPRVALAHIRPAGEDARLFFILAGIAYLGLYHHEIGSVELEASLFTMLYPVGSPVYRGGREVLSKAYEETWTDASFRVTKTWGLGTPLRARAAAEYQIAARRYHGTDDKAPDFVLPDDTSVHEGDLVFGIDTRTRGITGDFARGWEIELGVAHELRADWNEWGSAGGSEYDDPDAERATTVFGSFELHKTFGEAGGLVFHAKLRGAQGFGLDRLTYLRLGGGGFGRQFDRVGAGSTGAANDGELFRMDGVPGYFGGEFLADRYVQLNVEIDVPAGNLSAFHLSAAWARLADAQEAGATTDLAGFGVGYTRIFNWESGIRLDIGYSPRPDGEPHDSADVTFTYLKKF